MPQRFPYNSDAGAIYARSFSLYENLPPDQRLFFYGEEDCTNFISQCVWASYGGWLPGFTDKAVESNASRILADYRQVKGVWYGSARNIGSNRWCRVEEFYRYVTDQNKTKGPRARMISEGEWSDVDPSSIRKGDVIQMVVTSYVSNRFGHGLYVTQQGSAWDDILICCHTQDRLDEPMSWFAQFPRTYSRLRVLRFEAAVFDE